MVISVVAAAVVVTAVMTSQLDMRGSRTLPQVSPNVSHKEE